MDADTAYTIAIVLFGVGAGTVAINILLLWFNVKIYTKVLRERGSPRRRQKADHDDW
jgi:hypothetical protein